MVSLKGLTYKVWIDHRYIIFKSFNDYFYGFRVLSNRFYIRNGNNLKTMYYDYNNYIVGIIHFKCICIYR